MGVSHTGCPFRTQKHRLVFWLKSGNFFKEHLLLWNFVEWCWDEKCALACCFIRLKFRKDYSLSQESMFYNKKTVYRLSSFSCEDQGLTSAATVTINVNQKRLWKVSLIKVASMPEGYLIRCVIHIRTFFHFSWVFN